MSDAGRTGQVVILDRDGTIVVDKHYLADPDGLEFTTGAVAGLQHLHRLGCRLVVITNQSGVGRGLLSLAQADSVNDRLRSMTAAIGVPIERIYLCPHTHDAGCSCRKPASDLLKAAAQDLGFLPSSAVVVGDKDSDIEFGQRVNATTMLIAENSQSHPSENATPDFVVRGLDEVAEIVEKLLNNPRMRRHR